MSIQGIPDPAGILSRAPALERARPRRGPARAIMDEEAVIMSDPSPPSPPLRPEDASRPNASLRQVVGAVFWSFFGVRKGNSMRQDAVKIRPHQVILVGVALAAAFVFALLLVVRIILRSAGA